MINTISIYVYLPYVSLVIVTITIFISNLFLLQASWALNPQVMKGMMHYTTYLNGTQIANTRESMPIIYRYEDLCLRDWSRSGRSYGNNTRVICCPAPGRPESAAHNNSRPTVINPDYNMTKQRYITHIHDKIRSKSPPNRATSPTCLHWDVTHLSLTTGVVALHIPSRRVGVREEHRQARKIVWPVNAGRVICRYQNNLCGIINHQKHIWECFCDV